MIARSTMELFSTKRSRTKFLCKGAYHPVTIELDGDFFSLSFGYNAELISLIKATFEGRKWEPEAKLWMAPINERNIFRLEALMGKYCSHDPYRQWVEKKDYSDEIRAFCLKRNIPIYGHQIEMVNLILNSRHCLVAAEMGLGKTLATIVAIEMMVEWFGSAYQNPIWVSARSPLIAARLEMKKWDARLRPIYSTYESLKKLVQEWPRGTKVMPVLVLDESSRCKTLKAQKSVAAMHVAKSIREEWGYESLIVELNGTPAPKDPTDWLGQIEILCPGFITEATPYALRERLAHVYTEDTIEGVGAFRKLRTWKDSQDKCKHCGEVKDHINHKERDFETFLLQGAAQTQTFETHRFVKGENEVLRFSQRLKGIAQVWRKSECTDLPAKVYEMIQLSPTQEILNIAKTIVNTTTRAADALVMLRTLSDGFVYEKRPTEKMVKCSGCVEGKVRIDPSSDVLNDCALCNGSGMVPVMERITIEVDCPKIDLLKEVLENHEEVGRLNVYSGFQGSVDRITRTCLAQGWRVIQADGRGWFGFDADGTSLTLSNEQMVEFFQSKDDPRTVFNGQPGAAGLGLTLTASPTTFFYSNDFNRLNRFQAEDRGHRFGMDYIRGGRILDVLHLPSDVKVISALKQSLDLQNITMEELRGCYVD